MVIAWIDALTVPVGQAFERALAGSYTYAILVVFWTLFTHLWYYMLLGPAVGVLFARVVTHQRVRAALQGKGLWAAGLAALAGMGSPACTFASIPVVGHLLASGFPAVPLIAFLIAAPLMNPSLFVITWGVMGGSMAVARTVSALALAMVAAAIAQYLTRRGWVDFADGVRNPDHPSLARGPHRHRANGGALAHGRWPALAALGREYAHMCRFVITYFLLSLLVAAALQVFVPSDLIARLMGGRRLESSVIGGLLGIPFYVCGGGAVATVAVLMSLNMGQGAALAFFLTGPATKVSTLFSLFAVMRRRIVVLYLSVTIVGGVLLGAAYGLVAPDYQAHMVYAGQVETSDDLSQYWQGERPPQTWQWKWNR